MKSTSRRALLKAAGLLAASLPGPVGLAAAAAGGPVRIRNIKIFPIEIPVPREELELGKYARYTFYEVETDAGVRGYCFDRGTEYHLLERDIRPTLVGQDLFAIDRHLKAGLGRWGGVEEALWDAIGKIAGQPVCHLLGGNQLRRLKVYLTCVWRGKADQSQVSYREQADMALRIKKAGFKGMKIRAWRPNPTDDADACGEIRAAVGPGFSIMVDRTADLPGLWDFPTALKVARALEKHNVAWLEEPFARDDFLSPARLARQVGIPISGGERFQGLDLYRECLIHQAYDILQPDVAICGGLSTVRMSLSCGTPLNFSSQCNVRYTHSLKRFWRIAVGGCSNGDRPGGKTGWSLDRTYTPRTRPAGAFPPGHGPGPSRFHGHTGSLGAPEILSVHHRE